jgi:hypothetical protein
MKPITKSLIRTSLASILVLSLSLVISLSAFEVYCRLNPEKFYSYGWIASNLIQEKIEQCQKISEDKEIIAVFGDSFVEYYGERPINLVQQLNKNDKNLKFCNFGLSGSGLGTYTARYKAVLNSPLKIKSSIFYLYEGNDFSDFLMELPEPEDVGDRKLGTMMGLAKKSYSLNFLYRQVWKKLYPAQSIDPNLSVYELGFREKNIPRARKVFSETPSNTIKMFNSNLLNSSWYQVALSDPDYFLNVYSPKSKDQKELQQNLVNNYLNKILLLSKVNHITNYFFIIPADYYLFEENKKDWHEVFRFNYHSIDGASSITKYLLATHPNTFYPSNTFTPEDYIKYDGHLTPSGNQKLRDLSLKNISK